MALIWKQETQASVPVPVQKTGFSWDQWYQENKGRLSEKRAKRYRDDPEYRQKALDRSRQQRAAQKVPVTTPYTVSFNDAAQTLGITVWVLREWRRKNYFPEPHRREGRLWFSFSQVSWLRRIQAFFEQHGARVVDANRAALENVTGLVYANWQ